MQPDENGYYVIPLFSKGESRLGHSYDDVAKAIRKAIEFGSIPVVMGGISDTTKLEVERICGLINEPKFLEESEIIQGMFKPLPSYAKIIDDLLSPQPPSFSIRQGSPRFGIRGQGHHDEKGKLHLDRVISIDLLPE